MTDLSQTISPKSDQLNADDLIGRALTIKISCVSRMSEADQPIAINFEGDGGKPYKPCKSMRRVLVMVWGNDGNSYVGRRMTLYRDEKVQFGGAAVGGIRISHVSNIERDVTMALTVTRANRRPYTVKPLRDGDATRPKTGRERLHEAAREAASGGRSSLAKFRDGLTDQQDGALTPILADLERAADRADEANDRPPLDPDEGRFPGEDALEQMGA